MLETGEKTYVEIALYCLGSLGNGKMTTVIMNCHLHTISDMPDEKRCKNLEPTKIAIFSHPGVAAALYGFGVRTFFRCVWFVHFRLAGEIAAGNGYQPVWRVK
jgi:hypothetical protein